MCEMNERSDQMNFYLAKKEMGTEEEPETSKIASSAVPRVKSVGHSTANCLVGAWCSGELLRYMICLGKRFTKKWFPHSGSELDFTTIIYFVAIIFSFLKISLLGT